MGVNAVAGREGILSGYDRCALDNGRHFYSESHNNTEPKNALHPHLLDTTVIHYLPASFLL